MDNTNGMGSLGGMMSGMGGGMMGGMNGGPQLEIAKKMGQKNQGTSEGKAIATLTSAIKLLNNYAEMMAGTDDGSAQAVRVMIRILGELLKGGIQEQTPEEVSPQVQAAQSQMMQPEMGT